MSAATQGSEESGVESEARDGSDFQIVVIDFVSEKSVKDTHRSTGDVTEYDLLGKSDDDEEDVFSDISNRTFVPESFSDVDKDFDPFLPTVFEKSDQTTPAKEVVIEKTNDDVNLKRNYRTKTGNLKRKYQNW